eukprot:12099285-Heterocapsa_arctica.AAC.1
MPPESPGLDWAGLGWAGLGWDGRAVWLASLADWHVFGGQAAEIIPAIRKKGDGKEKGTSRKV